MATEPELAYLAGIIDGEGYINVSGSGGNYRKKYRKIPHSPILTITNSNSHLISWIRNRFGGHLYLKHSKRLPQESPCWDLTWSGKAVEQILQQVHPYLVAKKEEATLIFAYRKLIGKPFERVSEDNIAKREAILEAMRILRKNNKILSKERIK